MGLISFSIFKILILMTSLTKIVFHLTMWHWWLWYLTKYSNIWKIFDIFVKLIRLNKIEMISKGSINSSSLATMIMKTRHAKSYFRKIIAKSSQFIDILKWSYAEVWERDFTNMQKSKRGIQLQGPWNSISPSSHTYFNFAADLVIFFS